MAAGSRLPAEIASPPESAQRNVIGAHTRKDILMAWTVELLNARVAAELKAQPADIRARFSRMVDLIEQDGIEALRDPFAKHLRGPVWELRLKGKDGIARALYVTAEEERVVVVRVFTKKTQATPKREIDLALTRAKEVT